MAETVVPGWLRETRANYANKNKLWRKGVSQESLNSPELIAEDIIVSRGKKIRSGAPIISPPPEENRRLRELRGGG